MKNAAHFLVSALAGVMLLTGASWSWAGPSVSETFEGSSGALAAEAVFELSGSTLTVTLTNTSTTAVRVPTDVLTGVLFDTSTALTPVSASISSGSRAVEGSISNAGNGWGYASRLSANGFNSAISSTGAFHGLGHSNFSTENNALHGLNYGIVSAGGISGSANTGVTGHGPLIENSVTFTLTAGPGFSLSQLGTSIGFQYGTSASDTHYNGVDPPSVAAPEPSTLALAVLGGLGFLGYALRRRLRG